jgi:hypothetical protein
MSGRSLAKQVPAYGTPENVNYIQDDLMDDVGLRTHHRHCSKTDPDCQSATYR